MKHVQRTRAVAQALVEFALAATLIFFLLAAAVDLGLMFMTVQALHNAAQEGANYGSRWLKINSDGSSTVDVDKVRDRVRNESGPSGGVSGINLKDLNADGIPDDQQPTVLSNNIQVKLLTDESEDGDPTKDVANGTDEDVACPDPSVSLKPCYVWVKVIATYNAFFPFATVFGKTRDLSSTYIIPIRNAYTRTAGRGTMVPATQVVTPTPANLAISLLRYIKPNGNNPLSIAVKVTRAGVGVPGASVKITINGTDYFLADKGNGIYSNCAAGSFSGSSSPGGTISAMDASSSVSPMPVTAGTATGASYTCP